MIKTIQPELIPSFFFFTDPPPPEFSTLSLHAALPICPERVSLSDVGRNRRGSAANLIRQSKVPAERRVQRQTIGPARQLPPAVPCLEGIELVHPGNLGNRSLD